MLLRYARMYQHSRIRLDVDMETEFPISLFTSDHALVQKLIQSNRSLGEYYVYLDKFSLQMVRVWLEEIAPSLNAIQARKGYWPQTLVQIRESARIQKGGLSQGNEFVTKMDPDAPTRQGRRLVSEDQTHDQDLCRSIFEYIRRGNIQAAAELARQSDEPWRAASLRGGTLYMDPVMGAPLPFLTKETDEPGTAPCLTRGNPNRDLWKAVCYQMAREVRFS